jgi:hypothetical protein
MPATTDAMSGCEARMSLPNLQANHSLSRTIKCGVQTAFPPASDNAVRLPRRPEEWVCLQGNGLFIGQGLLHVHWPACLVRRALTFSALRSDQIGSVVICIAFISRDSIPDFEMHARPPLTSFAHSAVASLAMQNLFLVLLGFRSTLF